MTPATIGIISIGCYLVSTLLIARDILIEKSTRYAIYPAWIAVILHIVYTVAVALRLNQLDFGIFSIGSTTSAIIALLFILTNLSKPIEKLGIVMFPLAVLMLFLKMTLPSPIHEIQYHNWQMNVHIFCSIIAYSLLNIAALQAVFLAVQEKLLRKHPPKKIVLTLPPLQSMETLLFQMIIAGLAFLSVSLLTGFIFIDDIFAQHLSHKTVLSILAWSIFTALIVGRCRYGWRGKKAIHWTLIGFTFLLLAYFGSKLVLELILHR